jgi:hypothetical protein
VIVGNPAPLDQFYYLKNFETVLGSLRERYADLLSDDFCADCGGLLS